MFRNPNQRSLGFVRGTDCEHRPRIQDQALQLAPCVFAVSVRNARSSCDVCAACRAQLSSLEEVRDLASHRRFASQTAHRGASEREYSRDFASLASHRTICVAPRLLLASENLERLRRTLRRTPRAPPPISQDAASSSPLAAGDRPNVQTIDAAAVRRCYSAPSRDGTPRGLY